MVLGSLVIEAERVVDGSGAVADDGDRDLVVDVGVVDVEGVRGGELPVAGVGDRGVEREDGTSDAVHGDSVGARVTACCAEGGEGCGMSAAVASRSVATDRRRNWLGRHRTAPGDMERHLRRGRRDAR